MRRRHGSDLLIMAKYCPHCNIERELEDVDNGIIKVSIVGKLPNRFLGICPICCCYLQDLGRMVWTEKVPKGK